jgi:hypothetical protein
MNLGSSIPPMLRRMCASVNDPTNGSVSGLEGFVLNDEGKE